IDQNYYTIHFTFRPVIRQEVIPEFVLVFLFDCYRQKGIMLRADSVCLILYMLCKDNKKLALKGNLLSICSDYSEILLNKQI
ncbi:MAG: hypothetical protein LKK31_09725, partial [Prevotella sp.]